MTINDIRDMFPALGQQVYSRPLVYFDNAATSQRLENAVRRLDGLALGANANIHRAVHKLASDATKEYESTRDAVRDFLNAGSREEIIFTSGTTASINLVAYSFGETFIGEGDEIIVSEEEHHSNIVPWQLLCERKKAVLKVLGIDDEGHLKVEDLKMLITPRTKLVAVAQVSNVLGIVNPVKEIVNLCHSMGCPVLVDGAQGIVHIGADVRDLDCDFYAFSGHKLYAATGTGVLYGKKKWLEKMVPFMGGGEMIGSVKFTGTTYAPLPGKFEAGTQNINAVPTLKDSISFLSMINKDDELQRELMSVDEYMYSSLSQIKGENEVRLFGVPRGTERKIPLYSFVVQGAHHEDLALILDKMGIAVRSGQMCAEPLMDRFGVTGMVRVSLAPYNTMAEAEYFIKSLGKAVSMLA
ncbi:MAG: SufS family cysteine desulfurase [Bacteroidales bacterium]|nr:SufS family cysteine desulfurase [Bacteroidales bacterium]